MAYISKQRGLQLLELLIVLAILGTITSIALPSYEDSQNKTNNALAEADLVQISDALDMHYTLNGEFPDSLADVRWEGKNDPWGNPYAYLKILGADLKGKGSLRKDKSLSPVNSDFDLYSMGADGETSLPFPAKKAHDDIVRASNGDYFGLAEDF